MIQTALARNMKFMLIALIATGSGSTASAASTTGLVPLNDLGTGLYLDQFQGGLYAGGSNQAPAVHTLAGLAHAADIRPRDAAGSLSPTGKYVLLSVGMSNTIQEFCGGSPARPTAGSFMGQAATNSYVNHTTLAIVNGASGGQTPPSWIPSTAANYDRVRDQCLAPLGLTEAQVQAIWLKEADAQPKVSLPSPSADAYVLEAGLGNMVRACMIRYPNLQMVFLSSRIYAGYATSLLNPEPYAYETGLAVKWLIQAQINQMATGQIDPVAGDLNYTNGTAPWLGWAAYLWADGLSPRSDGLTWLQTDLSASDGTHPSTTGQQKVGTLLMSFFLKSPFSRTWFTNYIPGDTNGDGYVNVGDLQTIVATWGSSSGDGAGSAWNASCDLNGNGYVNVGDLQVLVANWGRSI